MTLAEPSPVSTSRPMMNLLVMNWLDRENPKAGGAEVHLHETFGRLAKSGWNVTLVTSGWTQGPQRTSLDGIEVHRVGGRHTYPLIAPRYVRRALSSREFQLTVEDLNKAPLFSPLWAPSACLLLVHHLFGKTGFQGASLPVAGLTWMLEKPIPRIYSTTPVVAVSRSTAEDLMRRGLRLDQIQVVENGVDTDHYRPGSETARRNTPTLLYLGRLKKYKRVDLILDAVAKLRSEGTSVRLLVAGEGDARPSLERHASDLRMGSEAVEFLGRVSEADKLTLLQGAWVHVLTSVKEGWGITNMEAAACATPTVASDSPGLRDSVIDGQTGFLVPHGDVSALADKIRILVSDSEQRKKMAAAGRAFALEFSWDRAAERLASAFEAAVASPRGVD